MEQMQGMLNATGRRVALVAGRFNDLIVSRLIEGATDCFVRHGGDEKNLLLVRVPGSFEIPLAAGRLAAAGKHDAVVALGAVIRGGTPHFDYVAAEVSKGIASESLRTGLPIIFGVLTCDTLEQALERGRGQERQQGMGRDARCAGDGRPHAAPALRDRAIPTPAPRGGAGAGRARWDSLWGAAKAWSLRAAARRPCLVPPPGCSAVLCPRQGLPRTRQRFSRLIVGQYSSPK